MLFNYQECKKMYGTDRVIKRVMEEGQLYKIERGIYSDKEYVSELSIIMKKYPHTILTLNSAFYYHGLTDVVPDYYHLMSDRGSKKLNDKRIKQYFDNSLHVELGLTTMNYNNVNIHIYNKERLFVELVRHKSKMPFDYYKEIIKRYRLVVDQLDIALIQEYASLLPKTNIVLETLQMEVL